MQSIHKKTPDTANKPSKGKFFLLLAASTLFFACEGFDSITALFGIFPLSPAVMLFIGLGFSLISVAVFYGLELFELSKQFGITVKNSPHLVKDYFSHLKRIKKTSASIDAKYHRANEEKLLKYQTKLNQLTSELIQLGRDSLLINAALDSPKLVIARKVMEVVLGLTAFSLGYFAGQTLTVYLATVLVTGVSIAAWPAVLVSLVIAACSFYRYWCVERPEIDQAVGRWMGLDRAKIESLCQPEHLEGVKKDIELLHEKLDSYRTKLLQIKAFSVSESIASPTADASCVQQNVSAAEAVYLSCSADSFFSPSRQAACSERSPSSVRACSSIMG